MSSTRHLTLLVALAVAAGCSSEQAEEGQTSQETSQPAVESNAPPAPAGEIDQELAALGEGLFQSKGCVACHTIGKGRLTGPDLQGVADRREYGWMTAMMMNPDSMVKADPVAKQLLAEYMTPMLSLAVTAEEARAIYEHLRREQ